VATLVTAAVKQCETLQVPLIWRQASGIERVAFCKVAFAIRRAYPAVFQNQSGESP